MFEDPEFVVDETADEYKLLHPNAGLESGKRKRRGGEQEEEEGEEDEDEGRRLLREHFEQVRPTLSGALLCGAARR